MSIWISLTVSNSDCEDGSQSLYEKNFTTNCVNMAQALGVCNPIYNPKIVDITKAHQLIDPLTDAYHKLRADKEQFRQYEATNGWGTVEQFMAFLFEYLRACEDFPYADVEVSR
jgi:hypothetical protein